MTFQSYCCVLVCAGVLDAKVVQYVLACIVCQVYHAYIPCLWCSIQGSVSCEAPALEVLESPTVHKLRFIHILCFA